MVLNIDNIIKECEIKTGLNFEGNITINPRLTRALGRTILRSVKTREKTLKIISINIELSKKAIELTNESELEEIIKHEFAHYYCYKKIGDHNHNTLDFIRICRTLNTTSNPEMRIANIEEKKNCKYEVVCKCCNEIVGEYMKATAGVIKRNGEGYKSKCCRSDLSIIQKY